MLFVNFICYIKHYAKTWPVFASNLANFIDSLSRTLFLLCITASAYLHAIFYLKVLNFRSLMQISQLTVYV